MLRQFSRLHERRVGDIIRRCKQPHPEAGQWSGDQAFILWLEETDQQIAVTVENRAIFFLTFIRIAGHQVDDQFG
ncbi:hypothetical protein D3C80_1675120 [compost metagenome]